MSRQYSVPEELVEKKVIVKKYHDEIRVFYGNIQVCRHRRVFGKDRHGNAKMQIDIMHYLNTFIKKPGAVKSSIALKQIPKLKAIFDTYYTNKTRDFIEILMEHKHRDIDEIINLFKDKTKNKSELNAIIIVRPISAIDMHSRSSLASYAQLVKGGAGV